jgi:Cu(I)/Ag(I) efflux system membrane protein CusA/SilA
MIQNLIKLSLRNRYFVLLIAIGLFIWGIFAVRDNPIDAIPDLSENQVIVFTEWMGRSPQIIEDQVTFPLVSNLQGIPKIKNIRASSMFGMSFVYVIFEDNVDIYWARTRVMERLNYAQRLLPQDVTPTLGPDGTGVGHVFWYHFDAAKGCHFRDTGNRLQGKFHVPVLECALLSQIHFRCIEMVPEDVTNAGTIRSECRRYVLRE